jgi:uncharacterized protein (TIGR02118 family)
VLVKLSLLVGKPENDTHSFRTPFEKTVISAAATMPFHATVLYPNDEDATFDKDYYLKTHMPLVMEKFGKHGLKKWEVLWYHPGPDGAKPQYSVGATLIFDSGEDLVKALSSEDAGPVFGDVKNFSNKGPVFLGGELAATS